MLDIQIPPGRVAKPCRINSFIKFFRVKKKLARLVASVCFAHLIHYPWELGADVLSAVIIEYFLQRDVLKRNEGRLQHVYARLVCKREIRRCLQKHCK